MNSPPGRPWWKRKGWIAALAFWLALLVLYALSFGPVSYAIGRGWVSASAGRAYAAPLRPLPLGRLGWALAEYADWWIKLGERHRASD